MADLLSRRIFLFGCVGLSLCGSAARARERLSTSADFYSEDLKASVEPHEVPYAASFAAGDEQLLYIATIHEILRASRTFTLIEEEFRSFKPRALVVEGFPSAWGWSPDRVRKKIRELPADGEKYPGGEDLFACSLAMLSNVPFIGGEPRETDVAKQLEALGFKRLDIFGTDVLRFLPQSKRTGGYPDAGRPTLDEIVQFVKERSLGAGLDASPNADDFRKWYKGMFGRSPDQDLELLSRAYPSNDNTVGSILLHEAQIRDGHALGMIDDCLTTRKRVLVVYGGGHLVTQWHALTKAMGSPAVTP